jgi:hypothetical protein
MIEIMIIGPGQFDGVRLRSINCKWETIAETIGGDVQTTHSGDFGLEFPFVLCVDKDAIRKRLTPNHTFPGLMGTVIITKLKTLESKKAYTDSVLMSLSSENVSQLQRWLQIDSLN